jgi:hypothetical protein
MAGVTSIRGMEGAGFAASFFSSGWGAKVLPQENVSKINNEAASVAEQEKRRIIFSSFLPGMLCSTSVSHETFSRNIP